MNDPLSPSEMTTLTTVLIVPGYTNSGPQHWQSLWQSVHPEYRRVEQRDWDDPSMAEWVTTLEHSVREMKRPGTPVVVVAHSLGCLAVVHWALRYTTTDSPISAALLVAPPDVEQADTPDVLRRFAPIPLTPLPFASIVVASTTDPYVSISRARMFAATWGARFVDAGDAGHLNTSAGFGPWPMGEGLLNEVLTLVSSSKDSLEHGNTTQRHLTMDEERTISLFSYGTLQQESVQLATFGRLLSGSKDAMLGYQRAMIEITDRDVIEKSGTAFHPLVMESQNSTDEVWGMVFTITATELAAADAYEVSDYGRIQVRLKSGIEAWVYVKA